ncbi:MAG: GC-type dockerin domain-anchored protein [Phycisphaerales bacterium]
MTLRTCIISAAALLATLVLAPAAHAQFAIDWSSIDCGGGDTAGGTFTLSGTIAQPDAAAPITGGTFAITGGFWAGAPIPCYANCDGSSLAPILNVNDSGCFLNRFAVGDPYANCDGSSAVPILNVNDFLCFLNTFAVGCP